MPTVARSLVPIGLTILIVLAFAYILRFGSACPIYDEWYLHVSRIDSASLGEWLIAPLNGHRYPTARLLWHLLNLASNDNPWYGTMLSVILLSGSAIAMARLTAFIRGRSSIVDLLAPALLLHWGHAFNLLMGFQIAFALFVACGVGLLWQIVHQRAGAWAAFWILLMCGNGVFGLLFAAAACVWAAVMSYRTRSLAAFAPIPLVLAYGLWCFVTRIPSEFPHPTPVGTLLLTGGYHLVAIGPWIANEYWLPWAVLAVVIQLFALGVCLRYARNDSRALGLALLLAAQMATAVAVSYLRGQSLAERFVSPSALGWCCVIVVATLYGPRLRFTNFIVGMGVPAVVIINLNFGYFYGMQQRGYLRGFLVDAKAGMPPLFLGGKYAGPFLIPDPEGQWIDYLRAHGVGPLARIAPNPAFRTEAIPLVPGNGPFDLPAPSGRVLGLRIRTLVPQVVDWAEIKLEWTADGVRRERSAIAVFLPRESPAAFWVDGSPSQVRLTVLGPVSLQVRSAEWLLAE